MIADNTPVIIAVGQTVERIDAANYVGLSAADLAAAAACAAIVDSGADISSAIDAIAAVRTFDDSFPLVPPFGVPNKFPLAIARRLGINPAYAALGRLGGETPVTLLGEMAARIAAGKTLVALIAGGEAISTVRHLQQRGEQRDWSEHYDGPVDDAGAGFADLVKPYQVLHGLRSAAAIYGLIENARRARLGLSKADYAMAMGDLFAPFMHVAAANPHAGSAIEAMPAFALVEPGPRNRMVADPYPVRLCARDQVNQGAALIMTSVAKARALGIPQSQWVFIHGLATGSERELMDRPDLSIAASAKTTISAALNSAGVTIAAMHHLDFYSCFPVAVSATAVDALGLAPDDPRGLTVTGGLPFFGGPGNNYSTHAIATMVERLRNRRGEMGLIFANGGHLSKSSAAVLSPAPAPWRNVCDRTPDTLPPVVVNWHPAGRGHVETYTIIHAQGHPVRAVIIGKLETGARFIANEADAQTLGQCLAADPLGAPVNVCTAADGNSFTFA